MQTKFLNNPYVIGLAISILLAVGVILSDRWIPSIWDSRNDWRRELTFFGTYLFIALIYRYWRFRKVLRFWLSLAAVAGIMTILVRIFIAQVRQLVPGDYFLVLFLAAFLAIAVLEWSLSTSRATRHHKAL